MPQEPFRVSFYDSSDDEQNEYVAEIVPVMDGVSPQTTPSTRDENDHNRQERQQQQSSWLDRVANGTAAFLSYAFGNPNEPNAIDSPGADSTGYDSDGYDRWGYNAHRDVARQSVEIQDAESFVPSEEIAVDLRETILQYKRTPDDVYMRIILAALNFGEVQVGGDLFCAAYGNRELMKVLMGSGKVNYADPDVQEIIQEEIDSMIVPDTACGGRISPEKIGYLSLLCRAPSASLAKEQARLFRHAGFEFVKMLHENPHLLRNLPPPRWIVARILDVCYFLDMVVTWIGLIAALINLACVGWIVHFWLSHGPIQNGYWTILCYVVGYVMSIVAVVVSEEGRIRDYEDRVWNYPDNTLKLIPCIPVFEMALMYVTLRYEILRDKAKYFVIRYDLYNGLSNVLIIHTLLFVTPQFLLQYYISELGMPYGAYFGGYKLLAGVNYALYGMSMYLCVRKIFSNYSCDGFGFAMTAVRLSLAKPFGTATRLLIVMTTFYLESKIVSFFVSLNGLTPCIPEYRIPIIVTSFVTALDLLALGIMFVLGASRWVSIICIPVVLAQVCFSIYLTVRKKSVGSVCMFFAINSYASVLLKQLIFGFLWASVFFCILTMGFQRLTGRRLMSYLDSFYYWFRSDRKK